MQPKIICTSSAYHIGKRLKKEGINVLFPLKNREGKNFFPDGEIYAALERVKKNEKRCIVIHSGSPKPNEGLMELRIILEILKNLRVKSLELFFTYFPYGMQDKIFDKGETNIAESLVKEWVNYYGVKKIYAIDAHFYKKSWTKNYPLVNVSVLKELMKKVSRDFPGIIFISPDAGAAKRNGIKGMEKKRVNSFKTEIIRKKGLAKIIKGKNVGVVDDLLETGGTLDKFYTECKKLGAKKIVALVTHGVLKEGIRRIRKKYFKLFITNSINQPNCNFDVTETIVKHLKL